jgi:phage shock protein PspC (stress-responsive transcriptional regulator)
VEFGTGLGHYFGVDAVGLKYYFLIFVLQFWNRNRSLFRSLIPPKSNYNSES